MPPPAPGKRAFVIEVAKSGAPAILQYKQALKESGILESKGLTNETIPTEEDRTTLGSSTHSMDQLTSNETAERA
jgi:hypothetical protein